MGEMETSRENDNEREERADFNGTSIQTDKTFFDIDYFVKNPGFHHVAMNIFKYLDPRNLGNCRQVSKGWKTLIDNEKDWWQALLKKSYSIFYHEKGLTKDIKVLGRFTLDYYLSDPHQTLHKTEWSFKWKWDRPLHHAIDQNRVDIFKILAAWPYLTNFNLKTSAESKAER